MIYPKPYSIYLRGTIHLEVHLGPKACTILVLEGSWVDAGGVMCPLNCLSATHTSTLDSL